MLLGILFALEERLERPVTLAGPFAPFTELNSESGSRLLAGNDCVFF